MHGLSPLTNIVLALLAAVGIVPVLAQPWFAAAVDSNDGFQGPVELMGEAIGRWFGSSGTTATGAEVLATGEAVLLAVVAATVVLVLAMLVPGLRMSVRSLVRLLPFAAPVVVLVLIVSEASSSAVEPRWGAFAALAVATFMASSAYNAGDMPVPKPASGGHRPPTPPPYG